MRFRQFFANKIAQFSFLVCGIILGLSITKPVFAHGVSENDAQFVLSTTEAAIAPFIYLGAKHMVTGYDHLLFLFGVIFFLYKIKDIVHYVSLFTIGHSITLLLGVLGGFHINSYIVDAIIGLSVVYKAFDNMHGFKLFFDIQPNTKAAIGIFGLFHGLGLATKLQEFTVNSNGLLVNMVSFNVGVEIGQCLALMILLILLYYWRTTKYFIRQAFFANTLLMTGGFILLGYQIAGYIVTSL